MGAVFVMSGFAMHAATILFVFVRIDPSVCKVQYVIICA
jgi:hypothetical protein